MAEQKEMFERFKKEINNQILGSQNDLKELKKQSENYEVHLITSLKNSELKKRQIKDLKKFSKDVNQTIKEQIEEIKQLPFVKEVKLTSRGINIDVGKIDISYRNGNIYIGDFTIIITPRGIELKNRNPIIIDEEKNSEYDEEVLLEHPHIDNEDKKICFGEERQVKIDEYFASFQLKQLVYMIYLFLKTYSERDKYNSITYWTQNARRKEKEKKTKVKTEEVLEKI